LKAILIPQETLHSETAKALDRIAF